MVYLQPAPDGLLGVVVALDERAGIVSIFGRWIVLDVVDLARGLALAPAREPVYERVVWRFGLIPNAYSSLVVKLPARHLTFIVLANSDGLSNPFQLASGDVTRSLFAMLFLRLAT